MRSLCSLLSVFVVFTAIFIFSFRSSSELITWDSAGYYYYLPAAFIHSDITGQDISWMEEARMKYDFSGTLYQLHKVKDQSNFLPQYTCGMAIMYSPAFFVGHIVAGWTGEEQDGFSRPYQKSVYAWSLLIVLAGLLVLRKLLLRLFDDRIVAISIILIGVASNFLIQVAGGLATSHTYIFLLYTVVLIATLKCVEEGKPKWFFVLTATMALACLSRPSEMVMVLIPIFYGISNKEVWRNKWRLFFEFRNLFPAIILAVIIVLPQFIFWKITTGHWFYMSYANPSEGFDFGSPHTIEFLFSYRKGWFVYTPLMFVAFFGFIYLWRRNREWFWSLLLFSMANIYFLSSWSGWWYAQCFSQRSMVQSLPVMAIMIGALISGVKGLRLRFIAFAAVFLASVSTMFFSWQYEYRIINKDRMTGPYFWKMFGKTERDPSSERLLLVERSFTESMVFKDRSDYVLTTTIDLPSAETPFLDSIIIDSLNHRVFELNEDKRFTKGIKKPFNEWTQKDHFWMCIEAEVFIPDSLNESELRIVATAEHKGAVYSYFTKSVDEMPAQSGVWRKIKLDYLSPEMRKPSDTINTYLWWRGEGKVYTRNFKVEIWERDY